LINTFLGGEITMRFALKALVVLLTAIFIALHFLADLKGYWMLHRRKVNMVGAAVGALAVMTIVGGFLIIGSPSHIRDLRLDRQRESDLQTIQYFVANYWQLKRDLPESLAVLNDPLTGMTIPVDPVTGKTYEYTAGTSTNFILCATFNTSSVDTQGQGAYPAYRDTAVGISSPTGSTAFDHAAGRTCYVRTIDPDKYPPLQATKPL
jgi:hypothetical protein